MKVNFKKSDPKYIAGGIRFKRAFENDHYQFIIWLLKYELELVWEVPK